MKFKSFEDAMNYIAETNPEKAQELREQYDVEEREQEEKEKATKKSEREQFFDGATEKYLNRGKSHPLGGKSI